MRKVYLTERQYVEYVLFEYAKFGVLNESKVDFRKLFNVLFRGCRTFSDYARRTAIILTMNVMSAASMYTLINNFMPISNVEKQELVSRIEDNNLSDNTQEPEKEPEDMSDKPTENVVKTDFKISQNGIEHIKHYEKCRLEPYYATKKEREMGIKTIGWGHKITQSDPLWLRNAKSITQEQADELFRNDIIVFENELKQVFRSLPKHLQPPNLYSQGFIDVCISILYNSGRKNFKGSPLFQTLAKCRIDKNGNINQQDYLYTCSKIKDSCITQKGKVIPGLVKRRAEEYNIAMQ